QAKRHDGDLPKRGVRGYVRRRGGHHIFFLLEDILLSICQCIFQRMSESLERVLCENAGILGTEPQWRKKI
ncbi:MAG: hypothetical protein WCG02_04170, partial [Candidatus Taylorbacteria bacterium]